MSASFRAGFTEVLDKSSDAEIQRSGNQEAIRLSGQDGVEVQVGADAGNKGQKDIIEGRRLKGDVDEVHQFGGDGNDVIRFASRADKQAVEVTATGGEGADIFQPVNRDKGLADQSVKITDFEVDVDQFSMTYSQWWDGGPIKAGDGTVSANQNGDTIIEIDGIGKFTLEGVKFDDVDYEDIFKESANEKINGLNVTFRDAFTFVDNGAGGTAGNGGAGSSAAPAGRTTLDGNDSVDTIVVGEDGRSRIFDFDADDNTRDILDFSQTGADSFEDLTIRERADDQGSKVVILAEGAETIVLRNFDGELDEDNFLFGDDTVVA